MSRNQALLKNLDDTSSTADVLECLAACPQLCTEHRRALAEEMSPITTLLRSWLLGREGGAPPLRGPRPSPPPPTKAAQRKGKGKGKGSNKGSGGGGGGGAGATSGGTTAAGAAAAAPAAGASTEPEVEGEFFSKGRRGEGNRRSARESPELSAVVTHNLVVLLSALHRATPGVVADDGGADRDDGGAYASEGDGDGGDADGGSGGGGGDDAASRLLAAAAAGGQLAREQDLVFGLAEPLLDECLKVAARRASPQLFGTVVETKAMLRRRLWSSEDPSALDRQRKEVDVEFDAAVPSIKVRVPQRLAVDH